MSHEPGFLEKIYKKSGHGNWDFEISKGLTRERNRSINPIDQLGAVPLGDYVKEVKPLKKEDLNALFEKTMGSEALYGDKIARFHQVEALMRSNIEKDTASLSSKSSEIKEYEKKLEALKN